MIKTIIITGGNINKEFLQEIFLNSNFNNIIASDRGLEALDRCNIKPNYIIGDFDSINKDILNKYINDKTIKTIELKPEKDFTDTHMALKLAINIKSDDIYILGAIGSRIDHTIANIHILKEALEKGIACSVLNENNAIKLINKNTKLRLNSMYKYVSLIPLTTKVEGVTLEGFKYSLTNAILKVGESIGVSNEQVQDEATIDLKKGILVLIQSKD